jgi:hypothetical protein
VSRPNREMWCEVCIDPACVCYGVTTHWAGGRVTHRAFTGRELIEIALVGFPTLRLDECES